ncbi:Nucleoside diphosphate kinase 7 [Phlyctochytrium planicorne]|nr:Nucleoside diphosphate kinase 7 [Phlyctochytrium planicorne]
MYDIKQKRTFLKRTKSDLRLQDLHVGAAVNVNARQLIIKDYGDEFTQKRLSKQMERSLILIKPSSLSESGQILDTLIQQQFTIVNLRMLRCGRGLAEEFLLQRYQNDSNFQKEVEAYSQGTSIAIEVMRQHALEELEKLAKGSFAKHYIFYSTSVASALNDTSKVFSPTGKKSSRTSVFKNSTLALIRPHAIQFGLTGKIIDAIWKGGFNITDLEMFNLERVNAEEFLEIYKGVVPEYHLMLDQLTSGPCIALEITAPVDRIVSSFREFVGPQDPSLAKQLRPNSLRAQFGVDKVKNAVHCTDLEEDGPLEVQFFFRIMVNM